MSTSNTITKNDLANILGQLGGNLPNCPVDHKNLLWTNSSLTTNFVAQTVALDLSDYSEVEIVCVNGTTDSAITVALSIPVGSSGLLSEVGGTGGYNSGFITVITRRCAVATTGITFETAYLGYDGQVIGPNYDHNLIPYKIYGIKYANTNMTLEQLGIHTSTSEPTSADGDDGDIWFVYE